MSIQCIVASSMLPNKLVYHASMVCCVAAVRKPRYLQEQDDTAMSRADAAQLQQDERQQGGASAKIPQHLHFKMQLPAEQQLASQHAVASSRAGSRVADSEVHIEDRLQGSLPMFGESMDPILFEDEPGTNCSANLLLCSKPPALAESSLGASWKQRCSTGGTPAGRPSVQREKHCCCGHACTVFWHALHDDKRYHVTLLEICATDGGADDHDNPDPTSYHPTTMLDLVNARDHTAAAASKGKGKAAPAKVANNFANPTSFGSLVKASEGVVAVSRLAACQIVIGISWVIAGCMCWWCCWQECTSRIQ